MKIPVQLIYLLIVFLSFSAVQAQILPVDTSAHIMHQHATPPMEVFSGSGDDSIVCYKSAHRNIYVLITLLIIVIAIIAIKLLLLNKRTTKILKKQNLIIEEKNKNITDSINGSMTICMGKDIRIILPNEKQHANI